MLQTLLADRFNLKVHRETKALPAYDPEVGKTEDTAADSEGSET